MEQIEADALQGNYSKIIERIQPQSMGIHLIEAGILLPLQIEEINAEKTRTDKAVMLMTFIFRSGSKKTYPCFMEALKNVGCNEELFDDIRRKRGSLRRKSFQRQEKLMVQSIEHSQEERNSWPEESERNPSHMLNNLSSSEPSLHQEDNLSNNGVRTLQPDNERLESLTLSSFGNSASCENIPKNAPEGATNIAPNIQLGENQDSSSSGFTLPEFNSQSSSINCDSGCQKSSNETVEKGQIKLCTRVPGASQKEETRLVTKESCVEVKATARPRSSLIAQCHTIFFVHLELKVGDKPGIIVQPLEKGFPRQFVCIVDEIEQNSIAHSSSAIRKEDILIAVNGQELKRNHFESHEKISLNCRQFINSDNDTLKLTLKRVGNQTWHDYTVSLNPNSKPYGLRFAKGQVIGRYPDDKDIYIAFVQSNFPAQHAGIRERDTVLEINDTLTRYMSVRDVTDMLIKTTGELKMKLQRESWECFV